MEERRTTERRIEPMGGFPPLILGILLVGAAVAFVVMCALQANGWYAVPAVVFLLAAIFAFLGLIIVNPNQSRVLILFGRYSGSAVEQGYFWVNPFTVRRKVSLRVNNFNSDTLKVN
ncbi:MAG: SPFH domain-containing protein, partial [Planctomycetota bacterium]